MTARLPVRLRLTLVFALAMAVVLAAVGAFLYVRVGDSLLEQVDESLAIRAETLAASASDGGIDPALPGGEEEFAQVLGPDGEIAAASPGSQEPLLSPERLAAAQGGEVRATVTVARPGEDEREPARLLAAPAGQGAVVVVGASLEDRAEALDGLLAQLLVGGPIALLLAATAGYVLAGAALRPVAAMRRRAAEISAETSGERLPLPTARDELHRLGATLNAMLDRLDAGLRRERRFVADASHELRTPLTLLRAELELALRRPRSPEELTAALHSAADEVDRLSALAEDLLLAAAQEDTVPLRPRAVAARELLERVARRFAARAEAGGRAVTLGPTEGELSADPQRLEQALGNLVDNALRHGGGRVVLETARIDGGTALRVRDEGSGFPPGFVEHALERFTRGDEARTSAGAGLGLAIVDAVARAHGGEARARNRPEGGAEVTILLPKPQDEGRLSLR